MQPQQPTTSTRTTSGTETNPWMVTLGVLTAALLLGGVVAAATNSDPLAYDHSPAWWAFGVAMLGVGGTLLAGLLVAGAIVWQLQHPQR